MQGIIGIWIGNSWNTSLDQSNKILIRVKERMAMMNPIWIEVGRIFGLVIIATTVASAIVLIVVLYQTRKSTKPSRAIRKSIKIGKAFGEGLAAGIKDYEKDSKRMKLETRVAVDLE